MCFFFYICWQATRKALEKPIKSTKEESKPRGQSSRSRGLDKVGHKLSNSSSSSGEVAASSSSSGSESTFSANESEVVEPKEKVQKEARRVSSRLTPQKPVLLKVEEAEDAKESSPITGKTDKEMEKNSDGSESDSSSSSSQLAASSDALPRLTRSQHRLLLGDTPPGAQLQTAATTQAPALEKAEEEEVAFVSHLPTLKEEEEEEGLVVPQKMQSKDLTGNKSLGMFSLMLH